MRKWNLLLAGFAILVTVLVLSQVRLGQAAPIFPTATPNPVSQGDKDELQKALVNAAQSNQKAIPAFLLYKVTVDSVEVSQDGKTALVWMALVDPQSNQVLATEPGLAIARRSDPSAAWQITLPTSKDWNTQVQAVPESLLGKGEKTLLLPSQQNIKTAIATNQVFSGYLLPWEGGKRVWLTGSVAHFTTYNSCNWVTVNGDYHSTCRYAFDFSDGTMFRVLAARGGVVVGARWTCTNSDHNCLNYLALEDRSTNPVTTQLYLHLAQNSIPEAMRNNGTTVNQGDYLGLADNTGMSTGHHLHFMVVGNRWLGSGYGGTFWWGDSVDITFSDVDVNGGRPRLCSEAYYTPQYGTQCHKANNTAGEPYDNWFVSGNRGTKPPTAAMSAPAAYSAIGSPSVTVSGSASGSNGISRIKVIANYNNTWTEVGPEITSNPFNVNVNLCSAGVPNGPLTLALLAWDVDGNRSPLPQDARPIYKSSVCSTPVPSCSPNANQVALYTQPDYQGACQVFDVGKYNSSQFSIIGDNSANSIQVGANVMASLYNDYYENGVFKGRSETFTNNDPGLADNRIGAKNVSSMEVKGRAKPSAPILRPILNRLDASGNPVGPNSNDSILLIWKTDFSSYPSDEGGADYQATLTYPNGTQRSSAWQEANSWSIGSLPAGAYTWTVTARNSAGQTTASPAAFTVTSAGALSGTLRAAPFSDTFESGVNEWIAAGLWRQATPPAGSASNGNTTKAWGFTDGSSYADGSIAGGELTSPPIAIPAGGAYLRFRYYSATETNGPYWDQRHVQISTDGGPFQELYQMTDDPVGEWNYSPSINLSAYAGKMVRIRFYFHIIDKFNNTYAGWWIDDFTISTSGGDRSCLEAQSNDTPASATSMALNQSVNATICPAGDLDYYAFTANAGDSISIDVVAKAAGSQLDPYLTLLDGDGKSILAENDDIQYGVLQDSHLQYVIQRTGKYYLKVKAYDHPGVGGADHFYTLSLKGVNQPPVVWITNPTSNYVVNGSFEISAYASGQNGISKVEFLWHNSDWRSGSWETIGTDTNGNDGWKTTFNPSGRTVSGSNLGVRAYDGTGQIAGWVIWNLQVDTTPPTTGLQALPAASQSTAILLNWSGSDTGVGLNRYEIQYRDNNSAWTALGGSYPASQTSTYFLGTAGHTYGFRIRGIDNAGNAQAFPDVAQVSTTIASACTPDPFDAAPGDGTTANAAALPLKTAQEHNFCPAGDQDWVKFTAQAGESYLVRVMSLSGGATPNVSVTNSAGQAVQAEVKSVVLGQSAFVRFFPTVSGEYRVRVQPMDSRLWGTDVRYSIYVTSTHFYYLLNVSN